MLDNSEPVIPLVDESVIHRALERLRQAGPLGDSSLRKLLWTHQRLERSGPPASHAALDLAVGDALAELIQINLFHLRTVEDLPSAKSTTREAALDEFKRDYISGNTELEAWSALFYRYVRIDLNLQAQEMAHAVGLDPRQIRRRFDHGYRRLAEALSRREAAARVMNWQLWMRLKLPPSSADMLVGADEALADLHSQLNAPITPHLLGLVGPGGIGKTALAHALAHGALADSHFEDFVWVTLDAPTALPTLLGLIATSIGFPHLVSASVAEMESNLRARLANTPTLIVIDNADELAEYPASLSRLDQLISPGRMILTARLWPPAEVPIRLVPIKPLSAEHTAELIAEVARQRGVTPEALPESGQMSALAKAVGGNPLAARVVASRLAYLPPDVILESLADIPADGSQALVDVLFSHSWDALDPAAQQAALALTLLPADGAPWEDWLDIAGLPPTNLKEAVRALVDSSLVDMVAGANIYQCPPLARRFVERQSSLPPWRDRLAGLLAAASQRFHDETDVPEPGRELALLRRQVALGEESSELAELVQQVAPGVRRSGQWIVWRDVLRAINQTFTPAHPPSASLARVKLELGVASRWLGELEPARAALEESIADFGEAGQFDGQAEALVELALLHETAGRSAEAEQAYERAAAGKRYHDPAIQRRALIGLAGLALLADRPALALKQMDEALATFDGEPPDGHAMSMIGHVHLQLGDPARAVEAGEKAVALLREEGDLPKQARAHLRLGMAYHAAQQPEDALHHLGQGSGLMRALGDALGQARVLTNLGAVYASGSRFDEALAAWRDAIALQEKLGDRVGMAYTWHNLADVQWKMDQRAAARRSLDEARRLAAELNLLSLLAMVEKHPAAGE